MEQCRIENLYDLNETIAKDLFEGLTYPWEALPLISDFIKKLGPTLDPEEYEQHSPSGFEKDPGRWVIFPRLSFANHRKIEERNARLRDVFSASPLNRIEPEEDLSGCRKGIATGGFSYTYVMEARK